MNHNGLKVLPLITLCLSLVACGGGGSSSEPNTDGDSRSNAQDNCPNIANDDQLNTDANFENGDALGDACDDDDDADGVLDASDDFPLDPTESKDTDQDTIGDNTDNCLTVANLDQLNNDGDALGNACDAFIDDASETIDTDGDNIGDNQDNCLDIANTDQLNTDANFENGDALGDACDDDKDADGVANATDDLPLDPTDSVDTDGDGYGNNNGSDFFPNDPNEWQDTDFDGVGDNADLFPHDGTEWSDLDGDQIGDNSDPDKDGDGHNNDVDAFDEDPTEWADNDPNEAGEIVGDGIGDNQDLDLTSTNVNSINIERMVAVTPNRATKIIMPESSRRHIEASSVGDVNNDGIDDLIFSNWSYSTDELTNAGMAFLVFGQQEGWPDKLQFNNLASLDEVGIKYVRFTIGTELNADNQVLGLGLAGLGDINADGIDDFYLSIRRNGEEGLERGGEAFLIFGREAWPDRHLTVSELRNSYSYSIYGSYSDGGLGQNIIAAGDMNGDGVNDLVIADPSIDDDYGRGAAYILFGSNNLAISRTSIDDVPYLNAIPEGHVGFSKSILFDGFDSLGSYLGEYSLQALGDFNQDGFDDIALSDTTNNIILYGRDTSDWFATKNTEDLTEADGFKILGRFGGMTAGDLNGDGVSELVLGNGAWDINKGAVYVINGNQGPWPATLTEQELFDDINASYGVTFQAGESNTHFGSLVSVMDDTNADGMAELLISKPYTSDYTLAEPIGSNGKGHVFKILGEQNWNAQPNYKDLSQEWFHGASDEQNIAGGAVVGGDFNGNGQQDLIFMGKDIGPDIQGNPYLYIVYGYDKVYPEVEDE